ncbi:RNA-guided endonuclease InsQ/TnpB family protein [Streptomyces curacoi]|uniref:Transposase n=1 Tax=Streptomyces curacoi TaxID=146536 RepID=A0A117P7S6_9ACTN|nr:RNA-guided endonuclease TnpB family protein [Streptomyces curacoi]KUM74614.1 transposase [Streptomyces curacoi]
MATHVKRAFKYRFYPTDAQAAELTRTFGCVRKVCNMALAARTEAWARQERVNYNQTSAMLTTWKKTQDLAYLGEVSSVPLQQALRHLQTAFVNFFAKRAKYPRFKVKKKFRAKMAAPLDIVWSRPLPDGATPTTVTVIRDSGGRWYVSLLCEDPNVKPLAATDAAVGIDVGLHKLTTRLLRENQTLVIEDLTVRNMVKNRSLARAISDVAWSEFRSMLEYKADWYGRDVVAADRFFPSSKLCSACGALQPEMPLNVRTWTCGNCGTTHDRDVNAAKNLLAAGLAASVCGAGVRPQRRTPGGQSARKQKTPRREP